MTTYRTIITIPSDTAIPRDAATNTWHFESVAGTAPATGDISSKMLAFYNAIDGLLSSFCGTPATGKTYDLLAPQPRAPIDEFEINLTTAGGNGLPTECAVAMSYTAGPLSGQPIARRRGRIFLGPLSSNAVGTSGSQVIVASATRTTIANAAAALLGGDSETGAVWSVFSPTTAGAEPWDLSSLQSGTIPVVSGWIDDAWDTVRSRGTAPTTRTSFS